MSRTGTERHSLRWARFFLALLPLLALLFAEGFLRLVGFGQPTTYFVRGPDGRHYVPNQRFTIPFLGPYLARPVVPAVLARSKPPNTYRIVILGESAARGEPNPAFSFGRILEVMLRETYPGVEFELINTGITAIDSHIVRKIVRDCRPIRPDLFVVFMGNNEVIGPYSLAGSQGKRLPPLAWVRLDMTARATRLGQLLTRTAAAISGSAKRTRREWGGMTMFVKNQVPADDPRLEQVYAHFRANLQAICEEAQRHSARVILCTVPTNLKDCPPFASQHRTDLAPAMLERWNQLWKLGLKHQRQGELNEAIEAFEAARLIDERYAELQFRLGECLLVAGHTNEAREAFIRARDLDCLRFRSDSRINAIVLATANERRNRTVVLAETDRFLGEGAAVQGIPGEDLFYEHVHLKFEGNYAVAAAIYEVMPKVLPEWILSRSTGRQSRPDLAHCAEQLLFSHFSRCAALNDILGITSHPPFPSEKSQRDRAELEKLEAALSPESLAAMAAEAEVWVRKRPNDLQLRIVWAQLEMFRGRFDVAETCLREVLERCPDTESRYWLGRTLIAQGRFDSAIPFWESVLADMPGHLEAMAGLAALWHRRGKLRRAIRLYRLFLELRPNDPDVGSALQRALAETVRK